MKIQNENLNFLKTTAIVAVVFQHSAMAFGLVAGSGWYIANPVRGVWIDWVILLNDVWMVPLLFFIAGYLAVESLFKRSRFDFIKSKIKRVLIPLLLGWSILNPLASYIIFLDDATVTDSFFSYWITQYFSSSHIYHLWFLGILFVFFCGLTFFKSLLKFKVSHLKITTRSLIIFFVLGLAFLYAGGILIWGEYTWFSFGPLIGVQLSKLALYGFVFLAGVFAGKFNWHSKKSFKPSLIPAGLLTVFLAGAWLVFKYKTLFEPLTFIKIFSGSFLFVLLLLAVFWMLFNLALVLKGKFKNYVSNQAKYMYGIYLTHFPLVIAAQFYFSLREGSMLVFFVFTFLFSLLFSWLISRLVLAKIL
jgi:glucans biosynthesis protein C